MLRNLKPKTVFLIDGIGALVSSLSLGILLVQFHEYVGMPIPVLYLLAGIAGTLMCFSLFCHFSSLSKSVKLLRFIGLLNLGYSALTLSLLILYFHHLESLGTAYFISEVLVIWGLVALEFRTSH